MNTSNRKSSQRGSAGLPAIKLGAFVTVTTLIAVGAYFGAQAFLFNDDVVDDDRRPVTVQRGTLLDDVTASGTVSFPELESLRFEITGTVAELLVDEGDAVAEGQPLILLDNATISALELAVANAEIALQDAGEDLAELLAGATVLERVIAESDLADARAATTTAANNLAEFTSPAESDSPATIDAKKELATAIDLVADLNDNVINEDNAVIDAEKTVVDAIEAVVDAEDDLTDAQEALVVVQTTAEDDAEAQTELVSDATGVLVESQDDYSFVVTGWFGRVVTEEDRVLSPAVLIEKWGTSVDEIFATATSTLESPVDNPDTPWSESIAWVWTHLSPFPVLTNCDETSPETRCPSAELDDAWDIKVAEEEALAEVIDDATAAGQAQDVLIDDAEDVVKAAENFIEQAQENVISAGNAVVDAEKAVVNALEAVVDAEESVEEAENNVVSVGATDITALTATLAEKIELANEAEKSVATLDDLDALQIKLATAAVNQANAQLENANAELLAANLLAPFDGVISSVSVSVGDQVNRNTPTIDILDPGIVTIEGTIDEIDVLSLRIGDSVSVTLDALPDETLQGVIDEIGDGINQQGAIEFPLTISLTPPEGIELIEGLSATATIILNQIDNALLIPLQALGGGFTEPTVDVVSGDNFVTTPVTLGASDDFWVIVESGLSEGQQVLMEVAEEAIDPFQQFFGGGGGGIRIPGAGHGPGGGGGGGR